MKTRNYSVILAIFLAGSSLTFNACQKDAPIDSPAEIQMAKSVLLNADGKVEFGESIDLNSFPIDNMVITPRGEGHSATGHFVYDEDREYVISFSAIQNDGGTNGQLQWKGAWDFHMKITCVNVYGNTATITGVITRVKEPVPQQESDFFYPGRYLQWTVVDNGEPGVGAPDQAANNIWGFYPIGYYRDCNDVLSPGGWSDILSGNLQVR